MGGKTGRVDAVPTAPTAKMPALRLAAEIFVQSAQPSRIVRGLGQEPIAKGRDFRQTGRRLRTYNPIRVRRFQREPAEWAHEPPGTKVPGRERGARKRNSL